MTVAHRLLEHLQHGQRALDLTRAQRILAGGLHTWVQVADGGQQHAGLAERGQHLADVIEEGGIRTDDQHTALCQLLTVGIEQVGRPV